MFKRVVEFEHEETTGMDIADWMRWMVKKIELSTIDVEIKKSLDAATKEQIAWAATALENTTLEQIYAAVDASGDKRSAEGVLLDFMSVNIPTEKKYQSSAKDHDIAIQRLHSLLSPYIVGRIRTLNDFERFKEIAQWLRLFLADWITMIEITLEDIEFKKSKEFPGKDRLLRAAKMLETTELERSANEEDATHNKRTTVGMIMSALAWSGGSDCKAKNKIHKNQFEYDHYYQEVIFMLSRYVVNRLYMLDHQRKSNEEIVDWLRRMADFITA